MGKDDLVLCKKILTQHVFTAEQADTILSVVRNDPQVVQDFAEDITKINRDVLHALLDSEEKFIEVFKLRGFDKKYGEMEEEKPKAPGKKKK